MNHLAAVAAVGAAYLIGSIPFGFLIAKGARGIDIRTVGSGNVGATNVGRVLGFRFFVLVMGLDLLKGWGPTLGFPMLLVRLGDAPPGTRAAVALAAILGHNFPVFLRFRGGKGVATSLGAVLALDAVAAGAAAAGFAVCLLVTKYVSMSSMLGGACFLVAYFARHDDPFGRDRLAVTLLILVLYAMLIYRHRANIGRIRAGTEPKVMLGRRPRRPEGRVAPLALLAIGLLALGIVGAGAVARARRPCELVVGGATFRAIARIPTGHQRAGALAFDPDGTRLAVACPRYTRLVIYDVSDPADVGVVRDVALGGRPVAVRSVGSRFFVLQRPEDDARHLEEAYWETFDRDGRAIGSRYRVGWDPDDFRLSPDGRLAYVLLSGHAEGEENRPDPELITIALGDRVEEHRVLGRVSFTEAGDDPERLTLSESGRFAAVVLDGSFHVAGVDLSDPTRPEITGRVPLRTLSVPYLSEAGPRDPILMPVDARRRGALLPGLPTIDGPVLLTTLPDGSALEVIDGPRRRSLGCLPLRGAWGLGEVEPTGLACHAARGLIAVADRAGSVHLVEVRGDDEPSQSAHVANRRQ